MQYRKTIWRAEAPSNIALIKYMGRKDEKNKIPDNASLSYTLPHLKSTVELEISPDSTSHWESLDPQFTLSASAQERFLAHLDYIQRYFDYTGSFIVRSCNNFPHASGLASSASSFAALTKAAVQAICDVIQKPEPEITIIAQLSRLGSGSSCRSFYAPWALWENETVTTIETAPEYQQLIHQAVIISRHEKKILSSQAHENVKTSPYYFGRIERAENRLKQLLQALKTAQWATIYQLSWDEFQDMHQLFETATPAFSYRTPESYALLTQLATFWEKNGDGPIITMDAGPNIHLLYRPDQVDLQQKINQDILHVYQ